MLQIEMLHHASLPVTNIERSKRFFSVVLGLTEIARPAFDFPGAWYQVGSGQLHLIVSEDQTFRDKGVSSRDIHCAIRVASYRQALEHLHALGYAPDASDEMHRTKESPKGTAGFPQVYVLDPDRNVIEINAERLD